MLDRRKDRLQAQIKLGRLHEEARRVADSLGLTYLHRAHSELASKDLLQAMEPQARTSCVMRIARLGACLSCGDGREAARKSVMDGDDARSGGARSGVRGGKNKRVSVVANPAPPALALRRLKQEQKELQRERVKLGAAAKFDATPDPFTSAIYSRVVVSFDNYKVSASRVSDISGSGEKVVAPATAQAGPASAPASASESKDTLMAAFGISAELALELSAGVGSASGAALATMRGDGAETALINNPMHSVARQRNVRAMERAAAAERAAAERAAAAAAIRSAASSSDRPRSVKRATACLPRYQMTVAASVYPISPSV